MNRVLLCFSLLFLAVACQLEGDSDEVARWSLVVGPGNPLRNQSSLETPNRLPTTCCLK